MARRKSIEIAAAEKPYKLVRTGGPKKFHRYRRVKQLARRAKHAYRPINAEWFSDITQEITAARKRLYLSQAELAKILRTSQAEISRLENGLTNPTVEFLDRLVKAVGIKIKITR
jgi:ribosome-binding protein aMBF1 (putative translation factor)